MNKAARNVDSVRNAFAVMMHLPCDRTSDCVRQGPILCPDRRTSDATTSASHSTAAPLIDEPRGAPDERVAGRSGAIGSGLPFC